MWPFSKRKRLEVVSTDKIGPDEPNIYIFCKVNRIASYNDNEAEVLLKFDDGLGGDFLAIKVPPEALPAFPPGRRIKLKVMRDVV